MLIQSVVIVFVVAAVMSALLTVSTAGAKREQSREFKFKTREIAEAALDLSLNSLRQATDGIDNDGDGDVDESIDKASLFVPSVVADLEGNLGRIGTVAWTAADDGNGNGVPDFGESNVNPVPLAGGLAFTYSVFTENDGLDNDSDGSTDEADESGSLTIMAQGRLNNYDTSVQYSGIFTETITDPNPPTWNPNKAFVAGGDLTVKGNCDISGANGSVHSNRYLDLGGSSSVTGDATSSDGGNIDPTNVQGDVDTGAPQVDVPHVNESNMQGLRDRAIDDGADVYLLNSDGSVSKDGVVVSAGGEYHGWSASGDTWTLSSNKADLDGVFYTTGDVKLTGGKDSISMTVLSEGNVSMAGNGDFTPYYENFFLISLHDIKISGTPQQTGDLGVILAREQVKTTGNAYIRGVVVAADLDNASGFVDSTTVSDMLEESMITGNFEIEYNGGFTTSFPVYNPNGDRFVLDPTFSAYEER